MSEKEVGGGESCFVRFHLAQKSHLGHPLGQRHAYEATSLPWPGLGGGNCFSDVKVKVCLPWRHLDLDVNKVTAEYFLAELHGSHLV